MSFELSDGQLNTKNLALNTKVALRKATLLLIGIDRSIGCSLKIHRVESALLMESIERCAVPSATRIFDCVKTNIQTLVWKFKCNYDEGSKELEVDYGITRKVKDLASPAM